MALQFPLYFHFLVFHLLCHYYFHYYQLHYLNFFQFYLNYVNLHYFYYLYYFFLVLLFCRRQFYYLFLQLCRLHFFQLPQTTFFSFLSVRCLPHQCPMRKHISFINHYDEKWKLGRVAGVVKWERTSFLIHTDWGN